MKKACLLTPFIAPLFTLILSGCGSSETEAPYVDAESVFTCQQMLEADAMGNRAYVSKTFGTAFQQLNPVYKGDTSIELFYRELVGKDLDYAVAFRTQWEETCVADSSLGMNVAATDALNSLYAKTSQQPRWATCRSFNNSDISFDDVIKEMKEPTTVVIGGDGIANSISFLLKQPDLNFDMDYVKDRLEVVCEEQPNVRLWEGIGIAIKPSLDQVIAAKKAKRDAEELAYKQAQEAKQQRILSLYAVNLYNDGSAGPTCENFKKQYKGMTAIYGNTKIKYRKALGETLTSMAKSIPLHQKRVFDKQLKDRGANELANSVNRACTRGNMNISLEKALSQVPLIANAPTDNQLYLNSIYDREFTCSKTITYRCNKYLLRTAIYEAQNNNRACEAGVRHKNKPCFAKVEDYFQLHHQLNIVKSIQRDLNKLQKKYDHSLSQNRMQPELEQCKRQAHDDGLKGKEYTKRVKEYCIPTITALKKQPLKDQITQLSSLLTDSETLIKEVRMRAL